METKHFIWLLEVIHECTTDTDAFHQVISNQFGIPKDDGESDGKMFERIEVIADYWEAMGQKEFKWNLVFDDLMTAFNPKYWNKINENINAKIGKAIKELPAINLDKPQTKRKYTKRAKKYRKKKK